MGTDHATLTDAPRIAAPPDGARHKGPAGIHVPADHTVLRLTGELDLATASELRSALLQGCGSGQHIVLDLERVTLIDSSALSALVRAHQHAKRHGNLLCLVRPSRFVVTVLHTMRLLAVFPIFDSARDAADWLHRSAPTPRHVPAAEPEACTGNALQLTQGDIGC